MHTAAGRCYACDAAATPTGLRDRRPEGGEVERPCARHAEPGLVAVECCSFCDAPVRTGSLDLDGTLVHARCYRENA